MTRKKPFNIEGFLQEFPSNIDLRPEALKTQAAQSVLKLMDSEEDGISRHQEFVSQVSRETGITIEEINKSLEAFI
jgi:hypothetical protein